MTTRVEVYSAPPGWAWRVTDAHGRVLACGRCASWLASYQAAHKRRGILDPEGARLYSKRYT